MDTFKSSKEELLKGSIHLKEYALKEFEHTKLNIFFQLAAFTTNMAKTVLVGTALTLFAIFISFGIAVGLGDLLQNMFVGYAIVASFYLISALILYALRRKLERFVIQKLSKTYFDEEDV
jgi:hypothetical protein